MLRALTRLFVLAVGMMAVVVMAAEDFLRTEPAEGTQDTDRSGDGPTDDTPDTVVDAIAQTGPFGTLHVALKTSGMIETLEAAGPFTVFAPTDDAFAAVGETLDAWLAAPETLTRILRHHIVSGRLTRAELAEREMLTSLARTRLRLDHDGERLTVGGAAIDEPDVEAGNGIIHGIDTVLEPPARRTPARDT